MARLTSTEDLRRVIAEPNPRTFTKILNELESSGFIKRNRSKADRRAVELMLTPKGAKLIHEATRLTEPYNKKMLVPLSEAEQRTLLELLNRLLPL